MHSVLLPGEVAHVQLEDVGHECVEHVEAGCLLHCPPAMVDHVEDGRQDLVHALHVLHLRVQPRKHEQDARHVVVAISSQLLRRAPSRTLLAAYQLVLLPTRAREKGHWEGLGRARKKGKLGLRAAGILLDLLPQPVVLFEGREQLRGRGAVESDRRVLVLSRVQKLPDELGVQLLVLLRLRLPPLALPRQIPQSDLPGVLSQQRGFIGNSGGERLPEGADVDFWRVEHVDEGLNLWAKIGWKVLGGEGRQVEALSIPLAHKFI